MWFTFAWKRRENKKQSGEMSQGDWAALVEVNSQSVPGHSLGALAS